MNDGRRGQETVVTLGVADQAAGVVDQVAAELDGEVLPGGLERGRKSAMHRGASGIRVLGKNTMVPGGADFLKTREDLGLASLMPFGSRPLSALSNKTRESVWRALRSEAPLRDEQVDFRR